MALELKRFSQSPKWSSPTDSTRAFLMKVPELLKQLLGARTFGIGPGVIGAGLKIPAPPRYGRSG